MGWWCQSICSRSGKLAESAETALRRELEGLKLKGLRQRAKAARAA